MQGVEILTSTQVATNLSLNWDAFWLTAMIILGVFVVFGVIIAIRDDDYSAIVLTVIIGVFVGFVAGAFIGGIIFPTTTDNETQYKVTISDEVSMTEFYEHYEVIEQDGKIFTVREKTNEE